MGALSGACKTLKQLVSRHLSEKSLDRIDSVFAYFGDRDFLDGAFRATGPQRELRDVIVQDLNTLLENNILWICAHMVSIGHHLSSSCDMFFVPLMYYISGWSLCNTQHNRRCCSITVVHCTARRSIPLLATWSLCGNLVFVTTATWSALCTDYKCVIYYNWSTFVSYVLRLVIHFRLMHECLDNNCYTL